MLDYSIVLDNGTGSCKIGYSGEEAPRASFTSVVGRPRPTVELTEANRYLCEKLHFVGDEAQRYKHELTLHYPMEHGIINNWEDMELIWHHAFHCELRMDPQDKCVLMTEAPLDPHANRHTMAEILFEKFHVEGLYVQCPARLCLYSLGKVNGLVIDSGDGVTSCVPIFEGFESPHAVSRMNIGGADVTDYLARILTERGYYLNFTSEAHEIVREIKETVAYVAEDYTAAMKSIPKTAEHRLSHRASIWANDMPFELPDGTRIIVGSERFRCAEIMFQPQLIGKEVFSLHECVQNTLQHCDEDIRRALLSSIIVCGGNTMLPGLVPRLTKELRQYVCETVPIHIDAPNFRKFAVWIGGAVFASHSSFQSMCVTADEYAEYGSHLLQERCPHS